MVKEGIVFGHKISKNGIEVDKVKVDVIAKLPHPTTIKCIRSFLGHARFYRRFIQDFLKISRPMTRLLGKIPRSPSPMSIKSSGGVFTARKPLAFSRLATMDHRGTSWPELHRQKGHRFHGAVPVFTREQVYTRGRRLVVEMVEEKALPTNDARVVCKFLKFLFARFGTPRAIISDRGTHFCNDQFAKVMLKYGVTHHLATAYHPQTSGQMEVLNCSLKRILERTVGENCASWSDKLDDALWAFCTAFKIPIGCTPYKLVYGKACHLLIELKHKAYWALKHANFDLQTASDHRKV
nr:reverse transcriptase domain-containing protein [Tanacetum cinerariifolium]